MEFAVSGRVLAHRGNVDVTCRVHRIAAGSSAEEFRLIEQKQIRIRSGGRRSGLQISAVEMIQRQISPAVVAIVDVIGRILLVAHLAEIISRLINYQQVKSIKYEFKLNH